MNMKRMLPLRKRPKLPQYNTDEERQGLRDAGQFNAKLLDYLRPHVQPGVTTNHLDGLAEAFTRDHGNIPACLGYHGYPKTICTSLNAVVCHGIPDEQELQDGDIVNIDCTTIVNGWYGDQSETFMIGEVSDEARRVVQAAFDALWIGIHSTHPFCAVIEIGKAITKFAREQGLGVVENYQGHGIGRSFHQDPGVPHVPFPRSKNDILTPGVSFTIEPMLNLGKAATDPPLDDGWTVLTADGSLSAQFEHQILMTEEGPEILTLTKNGPAEGHRF
jgi:methionyl aminopeptidase